MKHINVIAIFVLSLFICSCSKEESEKKCTINMPEQNMEFSENKGIFTVPLEVIGAHDEIKVQIKTKGETKTPAVESKNYLITSKEIIIPKSDKTSRVNVEFKTIDDDELNQPRVFSVSIYHIDRNRVNRGSNTSTIITLKDNDDNIYEKLAGKWTLECTNVDEDDDILKFPFIISTASSNTNLYNKEISAIWTWDASEQIQIALNIDMPVHIDSATKLGYISFVCDGSTVIGSYKGGYTWTLIMMKEGGNQPVKGYMNGRWSDPKCKEIIFDNDYLLAIYQPSKGIWLKANNIRLIRK